MAELGFRKWVRGQVKDNFERHVNQVLESRQKRLVQVSAQAKRLASHEVVLRALKMSGGEVSLGDRETMRMAYSQESIEDRRGGEASRNRQREGRSDDRVTSQGPCH